VFGLHEATGERIVAARLKGGPFVSLADFVDRARPTLPELESLTFAGALDGFGRTRPSLLLEARAGVHAWPRAHDGSLALVAANGAHLAPAPVAPVPVPELAEFTALERVRHECAATGLWFSGHPMDALPPEVERCATPAARLGEHGPKATHVVGMPCAYRRVETRTGEPMLFLTIADRTGLAECALFPEVYARLASRIAAGPMRVSGRVSDTLGAVTLEVDDIEPLLVTPLTFAEAGNGVATRNSRHRENDR
jgi:DNA polymerase III alpha subunit